MIMTAQSPEMIKATLLFRNCIANGSVMLRKRVIDEEQIRYDEEKKDLEDYDFWVRFVKIIILLIYLISFKIIE